MDMLEGVAKNGDNELSIDTLAKSVKDKYNLDLNSYLDVIFSELNKREIKRTYFELSDFKGEKPSTYEILEQMGDNTVAILSIPNDSYLIDEIGASLGGILILVKKTSVYYSSGFFIEYRYHSLRVGTSGLGGTSFEWFIPSKIITSLHNGSQTTLSKTNSYEKITSWGGVNLYEKLQNSNDSVKIPKNTKYVMISGCVVLESVTPGTKFLSLFKNDNQTNIMVKQYTEHESVTLTIPPIIVDVKENDLLDLRVNSNSLDSLRMKHFTVEIVG